MIAKKGRAARISSPPPAAQRERHKKELHGSEAKSAIGNDDIAEQGSLPIRRQGLFVRYKWPLVMGGVLLFAAMGAYTMARTLTHNRFGDFVPEFLKQFDRGAIRAKPAAAGEASANKILASQSVPRTTPRKQTNYQLANRKLANCSEARSRPLWWLSRWIP